MVTPETWARVAAGVALLLSNGFFVTTEFAMTRVPQFDEAEFLGHAGLERAWQMTERLEVFLSGCQVGITISSVGLGFVAEPAFSAVIAEGLAVAGLAAETAGEGHGTLAVVTSLAVINGLHVVVGEQAPTYLGVERTKLIAKYCAPVLYLWTKLMYPVIIGSDRIAKALLSVFGVTITRSWTEEEIEGEPAAGGGEQPAGGTGPSSSDGVPGDSPTGATNGGSRGDRTTVRRQMGELLSRGSVSPERREEVLRAFEIGDRPVSEVTIPTDETVALYTDRPVREGIETMQAHPQYSRYPLLDGEPGEEPVTADRFVGIVYASSVLTNVDSLRDGHETFRDVAAPPTTVDARTSVADTIDHLQAENAEMAGVIDDRELVGIVTATDAFEAITGELEDPMDATATD